MSGKRRPADLPSPSVVPCLGLGGYLVDGILGDRLALGVVQRFDGGVVIRARLEITQESQTRGAPGKRRSAS